MLYCADNQLYPKRGVHEKCKNGALFGVMINVII
jgi:hypothetical protein